MAAILEIVAGLECAGPRRVVEVGCGSGRVSAALAGTGHEVHAVDRVPAMLQEARRFAFERRLANKVRVVRGDVTRLPYPAGAFDLTIAIGVIPWLEVPRDGMRELARVTRRGGYVLVAIDNLWRLNNVIDPCSFAPLQPLRHGLRRGLQALGLLAPVSVRCAMYTLREVEDMVASAGLSKVKVSTVAFGPFTFMRIPLITQKASIRLSRRLQNLANQGVSPFRYLGCDHIVLARRP